jgi:hypothetical protein
MKPVLYAILLCAALCTKATAQDASIFRAALARCVAGQRLCLHCCNTNYKRKNNLVTKSN